jgi:hypothetical protein
VKLMPSRILPDSHVRKPLETPQSDPFVPVNPLVREPTFRTFPGRLFRYDYSARNPENVLEKS